MREIDRNLNNLNYNQSYKKQINETNITNENLVEDSQKENPSQAKEIKDLAALPAAAIGKTMITSDTIGSDIDFLLENPVLVSQLNLIFDNYITEGHTYEEASQLLEAYRKEFSTKTK